MAATAPSRLTPRVLAAGALGRRAARPGLATLSRVVARIRRRAAASREGALHRAILLALVRAGTWKAVPAKAAKSTPVTRRAVAMRLAGLRVRGAALLQGTWRAAMRADAEVARRAEPQVLEARVACYRFQSAIPATPPAAIAKAASAKDPSADIARSSAILREAPARQAPPVSVGSVGRTARVDALRNAMILIRAVFWRAGTTCVSHFANRTRTATNSIRFAFTALAAAVGAWRGTPRRGSPMEALVWRTFA